MPTRQFLVLTGAVYLVTGLLAFAPILSVGFLGDDWFFLDVIAKADNALVSFAVFNARFTRPIVAFTYYLNYRYFGLWPVPAHLAAVLLHVFNAWLVCVLTLRLAPRPRRLMGFGAGLIFLLFAGHSEAVAWVAGMADAAVVPFLIGALLLFDRALDARKPGRWMAAGWIVGACGLLGKETAMVLPALAGAFGMSVLHAENWRRRLTRTAIFAGGAALVCAGYWMFRAYRFGSALGAYSGMGTSEGQRIGVARMFILRTFVPPGRVAVYLWVHHLDLVLLAAVATAAGIVALRDSQSRRGLAFVAIATLIALGPALPLSISLASTLTERLLYAATVFSSILTAWLIVRLVQPPALAAIVIAAVAAANAYYLDKSNRTWKGEDAVFRSVVSGVRSLAAEHGPLERSVFFLLNMPDTIERPFVDGAAVFPALRLGTPAVEPPEVHVRIVAMHTGSAPGDVKVEQSGRQFTVDVGQNRLVDEWLRDTDDYTVVRRTPHQFTVLLKPILRRAVIATWNRGQVRFLDEFEGTGRPFGSVDLPALDPACDGPSLRFAGWALDDEDGVEVSVEREDEARGSWRPLGAADWRRGTRPDLTWAFHDFASPDRAEWNYWMPCGAAGIPLPARIRVVARDRRFHEAVIGTRTVRPGRR